MKETKQGEKTKQKDNSNYGVCKFFYPKISKADIQTSSLCFNNSGHLYTTEKQNCNLPIVISQKKCIITSILHCIRNGSPIVCGVSGFHPECTCDVTKRWENTIKYDVSIDTRDFKIKIETRGLFCNKDKEFSELHS